MILKVEPYQASLNAIEKCLTKMGKRDSFQEVMQKAINDVGKETKDRLHKETKEEYTIKASAFRKADVKRKAAGKRNMSSTIRVTGKLLGLKAGYKTRTNGKRKAAQAAVLKRNSLKALERQAGGKTYKAFMATVQGVSKEGVVSNHTGIFRRKPGSRMESIIVRGKKRNWKRERIEEIMGISAAQAAGMTFERNDFYSEIQDEMSFRLLKHMNAVIGG